MVLDMRQTLPRPVLPYPAAQFSQYSALVCGNYTLFSNIYWKGKGGEELQKYSIYHITNSTVPQSVPLRILRVYLVTSAWILILNNTQSILTSLVLCKIPHPFLFLWNRWGFWQVIVFQTGVGGWRCNGKCKREIIGWNKENARAPRSGSGSGSPSPSPSPSPSASPFPSPSPYIANLSRLDSKIDIHLTLGHAYSF